VQRQRRHFLCTHSAGTGGSTTCARCPTVLLYLFGMYISAGISLWRLIEHDFSSADGGANLKPAPHVPEIREQAHIVQRSGSRPRVL
jgi:hypothetical protein